MTNPRKILDKNIAEQKAEKKSSPPSSDSKKERRPGAIEELKKLVSSVYLINDPYITELMLASLFSHRLPADPAWIVIVGPSGGAKSEFINMLSTCKDVYPLSTLSSHTFISGMKRAGQEASLLLRIKNGVLTFKDMTSLLSENKDDRSVIMAQLREIYDGKYSKTFGTGEVINWTGKITVIAGATYAIHTLKQAYTAMGERFLFYNMIQPDRIDAARRTMQNQEEGKMVEKRAMLAEAFRKIIDEDLVIPDELPNITKELQDELLDLAELATRARSETERNWRSPQMEIIEAHPPEMPTRFAGQLQTIAKTLMIIAYNETGTAELTEQHRHILYKLALDSITKSKRTALQELARYDVLETAGLATKIGFPTNTIRRWLEDLTALGVAERERGSGPKGDRWRIISKYRRIMAKFENIEMQGGELTETTAEDREQMLQDAEDQINIDGLL